MRVLTGLRPFGPVHLGNYLGAIRPLRQLPADGEAVCVIADMESFLPAEPLQARRLGHEAAATVLAAGIDRKRLTIFRESDVPEIWLLALRLSQFIPFSATSAAATSQPSEGSSLMRAFFPALMGAGALGSHVDEVLVGTTHEQKLMSYGCDVGRQLNDRLGEQVFHVPRIRDDMVEFAIRDFDNPQARMCKSIVRGAGSGSVLAPVEELRRRMLDEASRTREPAVLANVVAHVDGSLERSERLSDDVSRQVVGRLSDELSTLQAGYRNLQAEPDQVEQALAQGAQAIGEEVRKTLSRLAEAMASMR